MSITEVLCRLGKQAIDGYGVGTVVVYLDGDFIGPLTIDVKLKNDGVLAFVGTRTVISSHTITAVTPFNTATGVVGSYTLSGAPDLTGLIGKFVRINAGPRLGNKTSIVKALSAGVFRGTWADQAADGAAVEPVVGDTVDIYSVSKIVGDVRINSSPSGTNGGTVVFQDVELGTPGADHSVVVSGRQVTFIACRIYGLDVYEGVSLATLNVCHVTECRSYGFVNCQGSAFATVGGTNLSARGRGIVEVSTRCLVQGGGMTAGHATEGPGHLRLGAPVACVDYAAPGLVVFPGATAQLDDTLTLRDSASSGLGVQVKSGGQVFYATGKPIVIVGTTPTNDYSVGGSLKAKAVIPYVEATNRAAVVVNQ